MNKSIVKSTPYGRLYIETEDFFAQKEIQKQIFELLDSDLIKIINKRNIGNLKDNE